MPLGHTLSVCDWMTQLPLLPLVVFSHSWIFLSLGPTAHSASVPTPMVPIFPPKGSHDTNHSSLEDSGARLSWRYF